MQKIGLQRKVEIGAVELREPELLGDSPPIEHQTSWFHPLDPTTSALQLVLDSDPSEFSGISRMDLAKAVFILACCGFGAPQPPCHSRAFAAFCHDSSKLQA